MPHNIRTRKGSLCSCGSFLHNLAIARARFGHSRRGNIFVHEFSKQEIKQKEKRISLRNTVRQEDEM